MEGWAKGKKVKEAGKEAFDCAGDQGTGLRARRGSRGLASGTHSQQSHAPWQAACWWAPKSFLSSKHMRAHEDRGGRQTGGSEADSALPPPRVVTPGSCQVFLPLPTPLETSLLSRGCQWVFFWALSWSPYSPKELRQKSSQDARLLRPPHPGRRINLVQVLLLTPSWPA